MTILLSMGCGVHLVSGKSESTPRAWVGLKVVCAMNNVIVVTTKTAD